MDRMVDLNRRWADTCFAGSPAPQAAGSALTVVHEDVAGDTKVNRCSFGGPLRLGDTVYARGIGVNSHSVLRVTLDRPGARLVGVIGLDRNVDGTAASVRFRVSADGTERFATEVLRPKDGPRPLDVDLRGARVVELTVDDGGDGRGWDQGDWADVRVVAADGSVVWLDDLARAWNRGAGLPFSFVYGGRPSAELLPGWQRQLGVTPLPGGERRVLTLTDPATRLEVRAECTIYHDTPGVDWVLHFANRGTADTPVLERVLTLDTRTAPALSGARVVLHRLHGSRCAVDDWLPFDQPVAPGERVEFAAGEGKSSQGVSPFFNVDWGTGGVITAVGWSGQWAGAVGRAADGTLAQSVGMQSVHLKLRPGESMRGPRIMQLHWQGIDEADSYNLFRRTMLAHVVPRLNGAPVTPPIVHMGTSFYELNDTTAANTLSHLEAVRGLGFEMFWLDAYWTRDGFPNGMGHYGLPLERVEPPDRCPQGVRPIGEAAHQAGMGFVLWFEPERVAAGTHLAREHPEWVVKLGTDGSGMYDLGVPEARRYMTDYLVAAIRHYGVDCLRIDYNFNPLPYWRKQNEADPDRVGLAEVRYVEGLYRLWDEVRAACPDLFIDNCASGGMRIDLETCARSLPLWRTDATIDPLFRHDYDQAALQNQVMTAGLSRYVPYSLSGQMGVTPYQFRSGFNAGIAFAEDCRPAAYPRELLRRAIAEGKRLRGYFAGDLYVLSEVTANPRDWCVWQYHRPTEGDGLLLAFRRPASPYGSYCCELRGIEDGASYEVTISPGYQPGPARTMTGAELARLTVAIDQRPGSVVVEYRRR